MKETILQFTLREQRNIYTSPKFWASLFAVICILGAIAPFDSDENFSPIQLYFYWGGIAISTFIVAAFSLTFLSIYFESKNMSKWIARAIAILIATIPIGITVFSINTFIVQIGSPNWINFFSVLRDVYFTSVPIAIIFFIIEDAFKASNAKKDIEKITKNAPFLQRISMSLGKEIISLQAQDHYVEVTTTKGKELVLIRLADAISELGQIKGQQVHRSWWVAQNHIADTFKKDGRLSLILSNAASIAVSRSYLKQTRKMLDEIGKN